MNAVKAPGQYAKFITAAIGQITVYLYIYGWAWHIKPAVLLALPALGVFGIPNTPKPPLAPLPVYPSVPPTGTVTITTPAA